MMNKLIIVIIFSFIFCENDHDSLKVNVSTEKDKDIAWKLNMFPILTARMSLGQFHNNKPFKAIAILGMKSYWIKEFKLASDINDISDRNRSFWWLFFLYFYGIIDAYVDSQIDDVPEMNDDKTNVLE